MSGPGPIFREIHRLRRHIAELESAAENGPRQLKAQQNKVAKEEESVRQAQETLKRIKIKIHEKETSIKATQAEIAKYERQLSEISTKKEYDALRTEIARARDQIRQIEDEILELMLEHDEKAKLVPEAEKTVKKAKEALAQFERELSERLQRYADEKARAVGQLKQVEATLPAEVRPQYDRLVLSKGADSIAVVEEQSCSACYTAVTPQMANQLRGGEFVLCTSCGRILYAAETDGQPL
ncbi:MAG: C4-type zinc ribbon domain-containing protein [Gemmataceae bacterium]|nr:C4-type zinc ribbon domain-containing protein [Gemmataceae bacterium]